jgi:hypothetical protein
MPEGIRGEECIFAAVITSSAYYCHYGLSGSNEQSYILYSFISDYKYINKLILL